MLDRAGLPGREATITMAALRSESVAGRRWDRLHGDQPARRRRTALVDREPTVDADIRDRREH